MRPISPYGAIHDHSWRFVSLRDQIRNMLSPDRHNSEFLLGSIIGKCWIVQRVIESLAQLGEPAGL